MAGQGKTERYNLDGSNNKKSTKVDAHTAAVMALLDCFEHSYSTFKKRFENDDTVKMGYNSDDTAMYNYLAKLANDVKESATNPDDIGGNKKKQFMVENYESKVVKILNEFKTEGENPGRRLYKKLKSAKLEVDNEYDKIKVQRNNSNFSPYDDLLGEYPLFDKLTDLLNDGDKFLRGSSSEYKEIKKMISDLQCDVEAINRKNSTEYSLEDRRYICVCVNSIYEKANQYVEDRRKTAIDCTPDSYKGKRIAIMKQVANILGNRLEMPGWCTRQEITQGVLSEDYMKKIAKKLKSNTFSSTFYSEYRALADKKNNEEVCTWDDAKKGLDKYYKDPATITVKKVFKNQKIDFDTAKKYADVASKHIYNTIENVKNLDNKSLEAEKKRLEVIKNGNAFGKNIDFLDHPILGDGIDEKDKTITGHRNFDRELAKAQIMIIDNKLDPKKKLEIQEAKKNDVVIEEPKKNEDVQEEPQNEVVGMSERY